LTAGLPFLFLPFAVVLLQLPGRVRFLIITLAVAQAWCMAMYRDVERGFGVLESILHVLIGGFQLPLLTVLSRMGVQYGDYAAGGVSPLPLFVLTGVLVFGIWSVRLGRAPDQENH
jgi:hypothetical protein